MGFNFSFHESGDIPYYNMEDNFGVFLQNMLAFLQCHTIRQTVIACFDVSHGAGELRE